MSTVARLERTIPFMDNVRNRLSIFVPKSMDASIRDAAWNLFPDSYLDAPDTARLPSATTPACLPAAGRPDWAAGAYGHFPTNYARFAAQELTKRLDGKAFGPKGLMLQAVAAGWHHMSAPRLAELGDKVGRERIMVVHGTEDRMLTFPHGETLFRELRPAEYYVREGSGHVIMMESTEWHDETAEKLWKKAAALGK